MRAFSSHMNHRRCGPSKKTSMPSSRRSEQGQNPNARTPVSYIEREDADDALVPSIQPLSEHSSTCRGMLELEMSSSSLLTFATDGDQTTPPVSVQECSQNSNKHLGQRQPPPSPLDLEREKTRLESFEAYVLVSILTASASFALLCEMELSAYEEPFSTSYGACLATIFISGLSAIAGLHATIVFSLCVLYGKTALGLQKDLQYTQFVKDTAPQRVRAFNSFSASLLLFAIQVELMLCEKAPQSFRLPALVVAVFTTYWIFMDWQDILESAKSIFEPPAKPASPSTVGS
uniref:Uncharacterized protein n=1 Tax=Entomoneis paludosa TaxID=265537 RepID=A0A7S2YA25_9STRA|mmetsp:Transcript_24045/g.49972  ORF Transcript_24045/g.49972 Transcript_24045/m.49972 type:complete len:290 (+) Transcript_24045:92-961(+)